MVHIKNLFSQVNDKVKQKGYPPIKEKHFLKAITVMQLEGKIRLENGEVNKYEQINKASGEAVEASQE